MKCTVSVMRHTVEYRLHVNRLAVIEVAADMGHSSIGNASLDLGVSVLHGSRNKRRFLMSKVWLVTGSASGLGRNIAEAVLASGDRLVATAGLDQSRIGRL